MSESNLIKIKINDKEYSDIVKRQLKDKNNSVASWNNLTLLENTCEENKVGTIPEHYTVVVNLQNEKPQIVLSPSKSIILFANIKNIEKTVFLKEILKNKFLYDKDIFVSRIWTLEKTYEELKNEKIDKTTDVIDIKSEIISSIIYSSYGSSLGSIKQTESLKGFTNIDCKLKNFSKLDLKSTNDKEKNLEYTKIDNYYEALYPYKYTIVFEDRNEVIFDNKEYDYLSDKLLNAILAECLVFYHGTTSLRKYLDESCIIRIHNLNNIEGMVNYYISKDEYSKRIEKIRECKKKILDEFQLFPFVEKLISNQSTS